MENFEEKNKQTNGIEESHISMFNSLPEQWKKYVATGIGEEIMVELAKEPLFDKQKRLIGQMIADRNKSSKINTSTIDKIKLDKYGYKSYKDINYNVKYNDAKSIRTANKYYVEWIKANFNRLYNDSVLNLDGILVNYDEIYIAIIESNISKKDKIKYTEYLADIKKGRESRFNN